VNRRAPRERRGRAARNGDGRRRLRSAARSGVGALAGIVGTRAAFLGVTVAGAVLVGWAAATPERRRRNVGARRPRALRNARCWPDLWLIMLPALLFGVLIVLVPLAAQRSRLGNDRDRRALRRHDTPSRPF
jgi:hypothetical protein